MGIYGLTYSLYHPEGVMKGIKLFSSFVHLHITHKVGSLVITQEQQVRMDFLWCLLIRCIIRTFPVKARYIFFHSTGRKHKESDSSNSTPFLLEWKTTLVVGFFHALHMFIVTLCWVDKSQSCRECLPVTTLKSRNHTLQQHHTQTLSNTWRLC